MVELLGRYSNRPELLAPMTRVLERVRAGDQTDEPLTIVAEQPEQPRMLRKRFAEAELDAIVARFQNGEIVRELSAHYNIGTSTIKRLLRRRGVRRREQQPKPIG